MLVFYAAPLLLLAGGATMGALGHSSPQVLQVAGVWLIVSGGFTGVVVTVGLLLFAVTECTWRVHRRDVPDENVQDAPAPRARRPQNSPARMASVVRRALFVWFAASCLGAAVAYTGGSVSAGLWLLHGQGLTAMLRWIFAVVVAVASIATASAARNVMPRPARRQPMFGDADPLAILTNNPQFMQQV
jgi:hypothetical protein